MISLAVEISSKQGSLALLKKDESRRSLICERVWQKSRSHSEIITMELEGLLKEASVSLQDIDSFCIGRGPGSFTGIRVGVNLVKSLAYSLSKPIYAVDSLKAMAMPQLQTGKNIFTLVNAIKNRLYVAAYIRKDKEIITLIEPQSASVEQLIELASTLEGPTVTCGNGISVYPDLFKTLNKQGRFSLSKEQYPLARWVGEYCLSENNKQQPISWKELTPLYIRASQAEEKLKQGLLKPLPESLID